MSTVIFCSPLSARLDKFYCTARGVTTGEGKGAQFPGRITMGAPNHCGGAPKSPNNVTSGFFSVDDNVTSTFINPVHLLPKDLSWEHGAPNLFLALGAI